MNTEQAEDEARQQQSRRDSQIAASKRQKGSAFDDASARWMTPRSGLGGKCNRI